MKTSLSTSSPAPAAGQPAVKWALAGRDLEKLKTVRSEVGSGDEVPLIVADATSADALKSLVAQTSVVITTVGPYQRYGEPLARACVVDRAPRKNKQPSDHAPVIVTLDLPD